MLNQINIAPEGELLVPTSQGEVVVHTTQAERQSDYQRRPVIQAYGEMQLAWEHFNRMLFGDSLPLCMITFQRNADRIMGYYHHNRFGHRDRQGVVIDEIAMNPRQFRKRSIKEILSTLVHEMAHAWQHHDPKGNPSRVGYHNKTWAAKMKDLGLQPTHNGQPDGREHGQRMTHIIVEGGPFDRAADLLISEEFRISWYDRLAEMSRIDTDSDNSDAALASPKKGGQRTTFSCPQCQSKAWGKSNLNLICGDCHRPMVA